MELKGKLYTVNEIAEMTAVTSRTIRNYMKSGILAGTKIGGQWRFTQKDIENLFNHNDFVGDTSDANRQVMQDFVNGRETEYTTGVLSAGIIIDYTCSDRNMIEGICKSLTDRMSRIDSGKCKFFYEYMESRAKARFTFLGDLDLVSSLVSGLQEALEI